MQTKVPAQQAQQNQSQSDNKSSQSAQAQFEDARPEATAQLRIQSLMADSAQNAQLKSTQAMMAAKPNNTGLPNQLKAGIEGLSGISMDHVRVHYNSAKPAQLQAHAYAQGSDIHVAPGQEKHLPHEAWHVVQQAQGRVKPTMQMKDAVPVNDDAGLEHEADVMGARALLGVDGGKKQDLSPGASGIDTAQHGLPAQLKTLKQAGQGAAATDKGLASLKAPSLGPGNGRVYEVAIGSKTSKQAAMIAAANAYAVDTAGLPVDSLLSKNKIVAEMDPLKQQVGGRIGALRFGPDKFTGTSMALEPVDKAHQAKLAVEEELETNLILPHLTDRLHTASYDLEASVFLDAITEIEVKSPNPKSADQNYIIKAKNKSAGLLKDLAGTKMNASWHENINIKPIDPFVLKYKGDVNGADFSVSYQHSPDLPGYVTHVEADDQSVGLQYGKSKASKVGQGVPDEFSVYHKEFGDDNLMGNTDFDGSKTEEQNEGVADTIAKLAGEGARFNCVRDNMGGVTDNTRFFVICSPVERRYVTLINLWSSWDSMFDKANGIDNSVVRTAIMTGNKWVLGGQKNQRSQIWDAADVFAGHSVDLT